MILCFFLLNFVGLFVSIRINILILTASKSKYFCISEFLISTFHTSFLKKITFVNLQHEIKNSNGDMYQNLFKTFLLIISDLQK